MSFIFVLFSDMGKKDRCKDVLDYDEVLEYIGQFGWFQRKIFLWLSLVSAAAGLAVVVFVFTAFTPDYRCRIPSCDSESSNYTNYKQFLSLESIDLADRCKIPSFEK